jgi:hypothetical protein
MRHLNLFHVFRKKNISYVWHPILLWYAEKNLIVLRNMEDEQVVQLLNQKLENYN